MCLICRDLRFSRTTCVLSRDLDGYKHLASRLVTKSRMWKLSALLPFYVERSMKRSGFLLESLCMQVEGCCLRRGSSRRCTGQGRPKGRNRLKLEECPQKFAGRHDPDSAIRGITSWFKGELIEIRDIESITKIFEAGIYGSA